VEFSVFFTGKRLKHPGIFSAKKQTPLASKSFTSWSLEDIIIS